MAFDGRRGSDLVPDRLQPMFEEGDELVLGQMLVLGRDLHDELGEAAAQTILDRALAGVDFRSRQVHQVGPQPLLPLDLTATIGAESTARIARNRGGAECTAVVATFATAAARAVAQPTLDTACTTVVALFTQLQL